MTLPDPFSRRFREGISFPNFVERSILKLPFSKICVPFALQNRALFKGEKAPRQGGQEEKRTRENRSAIGRPTCSDNSWGAQWHGRFATQFALIDSRESFAIDTPVFIARQADSHESLEFPIRANHSIRANCANRFARITPG